MKAPRVSGERQAGQSSLREDTGEAAEAAEADVLVDAAVVVFEQESAGQLVVLSWDHLSRRRARGPQQYVADERREHRGEQEQHGSEQRFNEPHAELLGRRAARWWSGRLRPDRQ